MKLPAYVAMAMCLSLLLPFLALAHDGPHSPEMRIWKDVDGLFEIEGTFVLAQDGKVKLNKHSGGVVWIPLEKLSEADRIWVRNRVEAIRTLNGVSSATSELPSAEVSPVWMIIVVFGFSITVVALRMLRSRQTGMAMTGLVFGLTGIFTIAQEGRQKPAIQAHFEPFKDKLKLRSDAQYFYVESNGMPDHPMMVGIRAWQQQVPIPQNYTGLNAWQIPLFPKLSNKPVSAKKELFRGAIALAVNGVPIFNPIKNDGRTDTYLAGELDEFGGHCGRGDDYHYHIAPVHLEKVVGQGNPIGYALDGFPLYGYTDANGQEPKNLDEFNGRMENGSYRYYSTKKYPYVNGGLRGEVTVKDDQIDPQPRAYSPRPALTPLRGATITGFERDDARKTVTVKYEQNGKTGSVKYTASSDNYHFEFSDPSGKVSAENYRIREDGRRPPPNKKDGAGRKENRPPPQDDKQASFTLSSPAFEQNGKMPAEFTGDGAGVSPPLQWKNIPPGTKCFALALWHKPKADGDEVKSYWVISHIPASVCRLSRSSKNVGKDGINDKKRTGYDPMNSKGPGPKEYHITLYALSAEPKFATDRFTRRDLLQAIQSITLAETTLNYTYERKAR